MARFAWIGLIGGVAAGCSSDAQRFAQNPFSNPFASSERVATAEPVHRVAPPTQTVAALPRGSVQAQALPPLETQPRPVPAAPAYAQAPRYAEAPRAAPAPVTGRPGGWTAVGGSSVTVGASDSLATISSRYGVPASAILNANGLVNASQVTAGRRLVIPVYHAEAVQTAHTAPALKPRAGEAPRPALQKAAEVLATPRAPVRPGQSTVPAKPAAATAPVLAQKPLEQSVAARAEAPAARPAVLAERPAPAAPLQADSAKAPEATGSLPSANDSSADFRWPARGRVIAGFGANGGNEGINIALPEGTPVKATEAGVVTYAGSEVKGYGNLVLIKHESGYVSAYAHNSELTVRRGERVKRGQVIAKSGQTGNVTSPQLHFEIRKGQTPVDPIPFLSGT